ncbi:hypothetical protein [Streptomyces celluloflavus]|uniref:hypothetical protein n=1 Tax=Streptomyces celluloflavus TaxID=58344 RepID=UPI003688D7FB
MTGGGAHWNDETQSWQAGPPRPAAPPPRPPFAPGPADGGWTDGPPPADTGSPSGSAGPPPAAPRTTPRPTTPRRTAALAAGGVVAVLAAGFGGWLLWGHGGDAPVTARPPVAVAPVTPSGDGTSPAVGGRTGSAAPSSPGGSADPSATGVPDGYQLVHDDKGFTTAVPTGWRRSVRKDGVFYTAPDDHGLVQIFEVTEPAITPRQALAQASASLSGSPGYAQVSLGPLGYPAPDAYQLVYAYDSDRLGRRVQVADCAFTAADGRQFALLVLGPATDWPQQVETQRIALTSFAPTG